MATAPAPCSLSPCFCKRGNYPAAWKIKLFSLAKGCPSKHRAIFTVCFFSHQLLLPLKAKEWLNKGTWVPSVTMFLCPGREWRLGCKGLSKQPWAPKWKGANIFLWQGKQSRQYKDWMTPWNKRENKVKPGGKKKGTKSKQDERDMTDTNTQSKPPRGCSLALKPSTWKKRRIYFFLNWNVCIIVTFNST